MSFWIVYNQHGADLGVYESDTDDGAIDAMMIDAGYLDPDDHDSDVVARKLNTWGHDAIEIVMMYPERFRLHKHADGIDGAREITVSDARLISCEDPGLVFLTAK